MVLEVVEWEEEPRSAMLGSAFSLVSIAWGSLLFTESSSLFSITISLLAVAINPSDSARRRVSSNLQNILDFRGIIFSLAFMVWVEERGIGIVF